MTKQLLDAILAKLAQDFPDTAKTYSPEVFADWLAKYQWEAFEQHQLDKPYRHRGSSPLSISTGLKGLSPTGRKPSQPEYQSLRPSSLPKWECVGDSTPRYGTVTVSVSDAFGDLSRYNKDRQPVDVYRAVAEQALSPTGRFPTQPELQELPKRRIGADPLLAAPYGGQPLKPRTGESLAGLNLDDVMKRGWVLREGTSLIAYTPYVEGVGRATLVVSKIDSPVLGVMLVEHIYSGKEAETLGRQFVERVRSHLHKPE